MATREDAIQAIEEEILKTVESTMNSSSKARTILDLAEARAWLLNSNVSHGGAVNVSVK